MGAEFSLDTIPAEILILIFRQLDPYKFISIVPLICKRISKVCISSIEGKSPDSSFLYSGCNVKMISGITIPEGLIINVLTHDFDPSFRPGGIYWMNIMYSAKRFTNSVCHSIHQFFNKFKALHLESLKCLMLPKMPPYFDGTDAIACHQMESLYLERRIYQDSFERLTSVKRLHLIINPKRFHEIYLPLNLECLTVCSSIDRVYIASRRHAILHLLAKKCKKLKYM